MSWSALLLSLAALGGTPAEPCNWYTHVAAREHCRQVAAARAARDRQVAAARRAHTPAPGGTPTAGEVPTGPVSGGQGPIATPTPSATPTPGSALPSRTGVDLVDGEEWTVRPSYRILAAGRIDFVTTNVGEDDHDLSVRQGARVIGGLALAPGDSDTLTLELAAGTYTLYCSLTGHEDAGMRANISVR